MGEQHGVLHGGRYSLQRGDLSPPTNASLIYVVVPEYFANFVSLDHFENPDDRNDIKPRLYSSGSSHTDLKGD